MKKLLFIVLLIFTSQALISQTSPLPDISEVKDDLVEISNYRNALFVNITALGMGKGRLNYQRHLGRRHAVGIEGIYEVLHCACERPLVDYQGNLFEEIQGYGGSLFYKYYWFTYADANRRLNVYISPRGTFRHQDRKLQANISNGITFQERADSKDIRQIDLRIGLDGSRNHLFWGVYTGWGYGKANNYQEYTWWELDGSGGTTPQAPIYRTSETKGPILSIGFNLGFTF